MRPLAALVCALLLPQAAAAASQRAPGEGAQAFAQRVLKSALEPEDVIETVWNGQSVIFASRVLTQSPPENPKQQEEDRVLIMLRSLPDGSYQKLDITTGEEEGGTAQIQAIGFANADKDPARELIVLLTWNVQHADVSGTLYAVRIFDDIQSPSQTKLTYLKQVSAHFDTNTCDCDRGDGKPEHFRFKTIGAIKAELKRMGFGP
jgi:hypothetical protein